MYNHLKSRFLPFVFLLTLGLFSQQANALNIEPLALVLKPSGGGANQTFRVTNDSSEPIAVQFSITTRQQQGDKEIRHPADNQFSIYPQQTIIPGNATQKIRVKWLGSPKMASEQAYRLISEQVHVSLKKEQQSGVNMLMTMISSIYVRPAKTKSSIIVNNIQQQGRSLSITLNNSGTRHQLIQSAVLTLTNNNNKTLTLNEQNLKGLVGNNVLAGATRRFTIPVPKGFANGQWKGSLTRIK
jgi:fimbrial chaperone protein